MISKKIKCVDLLEKHNEFTWKIHFHDHELLFEALASRHQIGEVRV
jgi:hypothetical protein